MKYTWVVTEKIRSWKIIKFKFMKKGRLLLATSDAPLTATLLIWWREIRSYNLCQKSLVHPPPFPRSMLDSAKRANLCSTLEFVSNIERWEREVGLANASGYQQFVQLKRRASQRWREVYLLSYLFIYFNSQVVWVHVSQLACSVILFSKVAT